MLYAVSAGFLRRSNTPLCVLSGHLVMAAVKSAAVNGGAHVCLNPCAQFFSVDNPEVDLLDQTVILSAV